MSRIPTLTRSDLGRLAAYARRDLQIKLSYRTGLLTDVFGLILDTILFYFIGKLVNSPTIPDNGPNPYVSYIAVGLIFSMVISLGLSRVSMALQREQMMGTLEAVMATPTSSLALQLGSVGYDTIYLPIRTSLFLIAVSLIYGVPLHLTGVLPALIILLSLLPVAWGLGMVVTAAIMTFKRGDGLLGLLSTAIIFASGAYFPLALLPSPYDKWAMANPIAAAMQSVRDVLTGGAEASEAIRPVLVLLACGAVTLTLGWLAFGAALRRERARGTMGMY